MIQLTEDSLDKLMEIVKEGNEVHIEYTPDETRIEIIPWQPYEFQCPYKGGENDG